MWQGIFPENTPLAKDIDYDFLSESLKLLVGILRILP